MRGVGKAARARLGTTVGVKTDHTPVRDRIPEIMTADGKTCEVEVLSDAAFLKALLVKLMEKVQEVSEAWASERVAELADVLEMGRP